MLTITTIATMLPQDTVKTTERQAIVSAYASWRAQVDEEDTKTIEYIFAPNLHQHTLSTVIHKHTQPSIPEADAKNNLFRRALWAPVAKDWLKCNPSPVSRCYNATRDLVV